MKLTALILDEYRLRLGWAGLAGLALAALAIGYALAVVAPRAIDAAGEGKRPTVDRSMAMDSASEAAQRFIDSLPDSTGTAPVLAEIYAAAARENLALGRAEYQFAPAGNPMFQLYQIQAPVRGNYVQVRRFIQAALKRVPTMALDDVSFRRQSIGDPQVEARIRFTVYLRKERP